jgi:hypothetical protein
MTLPATLVFRSSNWNRSGTTRSKSIKVETDISGERGRIRAGGDPNKSWPNIADGLSLVRNGSSVELVRMVQRWPKKRQVTRSNTCVKIAFANSWSTSIRSSSSFTLSGGGFLRAMKCKSVRTSLSSNSVPMDCQHTEVEKRMQVCAQQQTVLYVISLCASVRRNMGRFQSVHRVAARDYALPSVGRN